jgi:hypothetical protein
MPNALCQVCSTSGCDCMSRRTRTPADVAAETHAYRARMAKAWKGSIEDPYAGETRICDHCRQPYPIRSTRQRYCGQPCASDAVAQQRRRARRRAA